MYCPSTFIFIVLSLVTLASATPSHVKHRKRCPGGKHAPKQASASDSTAIASPQVQVAAAAVHASASIGVGKSPVFSTTSVSPPQTTGSSSGSGSSSWGLNGAKVNQIAFGLLPDDGSGGGSPQTMAQLSAALGAQIPAQGWYAQAHSGTPFDGGQLLSRKAAIVAAGGVFQPAIMPTGGWQGLTYSDNSQAIRICTVLKQFTDAGMPVWLRFAHEVNWYQTDGTYSGDANDFKQGWDVVAKACRSIAPSVKMWFTPNVASQNTYDDFFPDDASTVDLIGIDYYPHDPSAGSSDFLSKMQAFHDKYCNDRIKFAIGETGMMSQIGLNGQLNWAKAITSSQVASAMPHLIQISWFNYDKEADFRIAGKDGDWATKAWLTGSS